MESNQSLGQDKSTAQPQSNREACEKAALEEIAAERLRIMGIKPQTAKLIAESLPTILTRASLSDDELRERDERWRQQELVRKWREFSELRGNRYAGCRIANFTAETDAQKAAVEALTNYCQDIKASILNGENVVLFGPRGTGKDHLAMAVARCVVMAGEEVVWRNGMDLWGDFRDAMDEEGTRESSLIAKLVRPSVLYLSDPLPIAGPLTPHQMNMLSRILDGRYSRRKAILCTVNVASGTELDERMGPQNADRLKDGALAIYCNWPSYRKVKKLL